MSSSSGNAARIAADGPAARFGRSLAVVVGIDGYGDGIAPLRSAVADARAIGEALARDHGFATRCLFDGDAQLARLRALLGDELPAELGANDRLVLYFAGHGIAVDGDAGPTGYLLAADARRADRAGFLSMHELHGALAGLAVRHALVILDCCFAGTFRWSSLRDVALAPARIYRERYDRYVASAAWQVLTSASGSQLALDLLADHRGEGSEPHSPFARALLDALAGAADYTGDNLITADELALFVRERVAPIAESAGHRQVPQLFVLDRHDDGQFVFQAPRRAVELVPAPPLDEAANPYRGLHSFREQDRALFFGRDAIAGRLREAVAGRRLTVVVGPSGSGKSSLIQAGLIPALRDDGWTVLPPQRPGREPLAALAALTRALRTLAGASDDGAGGGDAVAAWLRAVRDREAAQPGKPWLIVLDQLEELITHRSPEPARAALLGALAAALDAAPGLRVVVGVRADVEPQLHDSPLAKWWRAARLPVPGLTRDELRDIITKPARAAVLHFEPTLLVERLIDDVALVPAPLPLLSFALSELYQRCWTRWQAGGRERALRAADYDEMGSVARALTRRATALHDELVAAQAAYAVTIRNVFCRMVAVVGGGRARRRVRLAELDYADPAENQRVAEVLQRFHDARLISLGVEDAPDGKPARYAEPMHDELVHGWGQVSRWLDELDSPPGTRALLGAIASASQAWLAAGHQRPLLWTDLRVELAHKLFCDRPFALNADEARFVARSVRLRRARRTRWIAGVAVSITALAVAAVVALVLRKSAADSAAAATRNAALAKHNEDEANRQRSASQRMLAGSLQESGRQLLLDGRPLEAVPYLVEARRAGEHGTPLRMLMGTAARLIPITLEHNDAVRDVAFSADGGRVVTASGDAARVWDAYTGAPASPMFGHRLEVTSARLSPDGTRVVTASVDRTARVWDALSAKPIGRPLEHLGGVNSVRFSADGMRVVTASVDGTARVWDAATGAPVTPPLEHQAEVFLAELSGDGTRVVTASSDRTARVWDTATGKPLSPPLVHDRAVRRAAFSSDGARVITASGDSTARVWDAITGESLSPPLEHTTGVTVAGFSPDRALAVTGGGDGIARVWDVATGKLRCPSLAHRDRIYDAAFSPDGARVVTASEAGAAQLWDAGCNPVAQPFSHHASVVRAVFSPDGRRVATASMDHTARIWNATIPLQLVHGDVVRAAAFSPDSKRVITASNDGIAQLWDVATGRRLATLGDTAGALRTVMFSSDGARVVTASRDSRARIWDATTGAQLVPSLGHHALVASAAFDGAGARVVTASADKTAVVWNALTGRPLIAPLEHPAPLSAAMFSPDGTYVVTACDDGAARVWHAGTGELVLALVHRGPVASARFSPDGARVITASEDGTARIWDAATGKSLHTLVHQGGVVSAELSPDGARVVTASDDDTAVIWDAGTGKPLVAPLEHRDDVTTAVLSHDGTRVVTASRDNTVRVWDASSGKPLTPPLEHRDDVWHAEFSRDCNFIVSASADKTARIWEIPLHHGTLAEWEAIAARSPYVLVDGVLARRPERPGAR